MAHLTNVEEQIRTLISVITGDGVAVGVYARHFGSEREIAVNAEQRFPTASTIKVPAGRRNVAWDDVIRRTRASRAKRPM